MLLGILPAFKYRYQPLGIYTTYGFLARADSGSPVVAAVEVKDTAEFSLAIRDCAGTVTGAGDCPPVAHAASTPAHATASTAFGLTIVANVPNRLDSSAQRGDRFHQQRGGEVLAQWGIRRPWVGDDRDKGEVVAEVGAVRVRL